MRRNWTEEESVGRWTLFPDELALAGPEAARARGRRSGGKPVMD